MVLCIFIFLLHSCTVKIASGIVLTQVISKCGNCGKRTRYFKLYNKLKKGKAIPLQAWTGSEGSRRMRLPDFKTIGT
jgi:hypothetical protein